MKKLALLFGISAATMHSENDVTNTNISQKVKSELHYSYSDLMEVVSSFIDEMDKGWMAAEGKGANADQSSLKMITSHINILPTGDESGVYFAVDLGGTNIRVLRVVLENGGASTTEHREAIPDRVMSKDATCDELFDFIANACSKLCQDLPADIDPVPLGFTFSFPYSQTSIKSGTLIEWTKGFETRNCIGSDPAFLLQAALDRKQIPLIVDALCNDTVGTLMTNAYMKKSRDCRIGVILGTGTNAAYSDPSLGNLIVNIEWGGFNKLKRSKFDQQVDISSPNPGKQFLEKMVSGMYLGELTRLATIAELTERNLPVPEAISEYHSLETATISDLLCGSIPRMSQPPLSLLDDRTIYIIKSLAELVIDRSAAIAAAALAAVVMRATKGQASIKCEVGIDGSLYTKGHRYNERLVFYLDKLFPGSSHLISLDFSEDGSGLGAALVAAAIAHGHRVSI